MAQEEKDEKSSKGFSLGLRGLDFSFLWSRKRGDGKGGPEEYSIEEHGPLFEFDLPRGFEVEDSYWVNHPYSKVYVLNDIEEDEQLYHVEEPELDAFEARVIDRVKGMMRDMIVSKDLESEMDREQLLMEKAGTLLSKLSVNTDPKFKAKVRHSLVRDFLGFERIDPLMHDERIEDISCDGPNVPVYLFHKNYHDLETDVVFDDEPVLNSFIIKLAQRSGQHISRANPMVDAAMPDGSRIQMTLGREVTTHGSTFTIRKFSEIPLNPVDLVAFNTFSLEIMAFLWLAVENNKSFIFVGGTASGKTTSMNAASLFMTPRSKIVTIEDTRELNLPFENWIPGVTRESFSKEGEGKVGMYDLLRAALRQRPEYLLVGEVRGEEATVLFQAMSTGHTTFSTMHADSAETAIHRLENPPINVPRSMIASLDMMTIQAQVFYEGERVRRCVELVEVGELDPRTNTIHTNPIFRWNPADDTFPRVGESKVLQEIRRMYNWSKEDLDAELERRKEILRYMLDNGIRDYSDVVAHLQMYYKNPGKLLDKIGMDT
ncbi:MAG: hypothetical protein MAG715_00953 [Methanonatronarchaeales archaeon]|nr:hypothetical protein [Methanonatronarchaeales archaeon]